MPNPPETLIDRPSDTLICKLIQKQKDSDLNDEDFAEKLGIGRATWILVRTRSSKFGLKFIAAVRRAFPDLKPDIDAYLEREPGLMELWVQPIAV